MSRLRESLPAYLQRRFGICRRTFERWCARGDVPGAYRTRGGHWRVRKATNAMLFKSSVTSRPRGKTRRDQVRHAIVDYPCYLPDLYNTLKRESAAVKLWAFAHGITEEDLRDINLSERDPEKCRFLWQEPLHLHPRALEAVNEPQYALAIAAGMIRFDGRKVTIASLACALHVSVATLYRRYGKREIRRVCTPAI